MNEIYEIKGELHYVWPMTLYKGNTTKCGQCAYFKAHEKPSLFFDGECTSVVMNTERGYTHRKDGNDFVQSRGAACKWFFLPDETQQLSFMKGENNERT